MLLVEVHVSMNRKLIILSHKLMSDPNDNQSLFKKSFCFAVGFACFDNFNSLMGYDYCSFYCNCKNLSFRIQDFLEKKIKNFSIEYKNNEIQ